MNRACGQAPSGGRLRDPVPQLGRAVCHVDQVHAPHHPAPIVHEHMEVAHPGGLFCEQGGEPFIESRETAVAAVGNRRGEIGPVLLLEREESRSMAEAETPELGHPARLSRSAVRAGSVRRHEPFAMT